MPTYADKWILCSNNYSGRRTFHDSPEEAKAHYDALMVDPVYMDFDTGDINYHIYQGIQIIPDGE
jgi:hypothetical protein